MDHILHQAEIADSGMVHLLLDSFSKADENSNGELKEEEMTAYLVTSAGVSKEDAVAIWKVGNPFRMFFDLIQQSLTLSLDVFLQFISQFSSKICCSSNPIASLSRVIS